MGPWVPKQQGRHAFQAAKFNAARPVIVRGGVGELLAFVLVAVMAVAIGLLVNNMNKKSVPQCETFIRIKSKF